jgi:hypothetical protein
MEKDITSAEESFPMEQKEWSLFKPFWIFMGLILVAACLGVFGTGIASQKVHTSHGITLEYNRFLRVKNDAALYVNVKDPGTDFSISINNDYIRKVKIDQVVPEPASVEINNNKLIYKFSSAKFGFVTFFLTPYKMGSQTLEITVNGNKMRFDQFIYF